MKRLTGFAALLLGVALTLFSGTAGAQSYSTALPHLMSIPVPITHNNTNQAGRLYVDSLSATLETSLVSTATTSDTTTAISLTDNYLNSGVTVLQAAADSVWVGALTVSVTAVGTGTTLGSADTLHVQMDYTLDGKNWVAGTDVAGAATVFNYVLRLDSAAGGASDYKPIVIWTNDLTAPAAGATTRNAFFGAQAIRFRLNIGTAARVTLDHCQWTYLSTAPEPGK